MSHITASEQAQLDNNFTYHTPKPGQGEKYTDLRLETKALAVCILQLCPSSRERSVALTKLEEVMFWANAAIARNG